MPTNRIFPTLPVVLALLLAALLGGCGGGSTATQSAGVSSLTTTSSVATPTSTSSTTSTTSSTSTSATATSTTRSAHSHSVKPSTAGGTEPGSGKAHSSGTSKTGLGTLAVASTAFPHGGKIPARYTCDGGNVSPPLQWGKVPAGTSQMFVIALSLTAGSQGAVRWAIGGIDPTAGGFAAGQLPPGAVVGRNGEGHVGWAGICPAGGKPQAVIVLVYALRHPLNLAQGFDPRTVQSQLHGNTLATGVVYGAYKRS
jgi:phosphatidylethanolamine-binding protein (PEBP) family uncharacterized protein